MDAVSRHARNQMRRLGLAVRDVEEICAAPEATSTDPDGRPRLVGHAGGIRVRVVLAVDNPDFVVTVHERRS
jgi:hypothetical protein